MWDVSDAVASLRRSFASSYSGAYAAGGGTSELSKEDEIIRDVSDLLRE